MTCIGRSDRILPMFSEKGSKLAQKKLEQFGVEVINGASVDECCENGVHITYKNGETRFIEGNTILWSTGVKGNDSVAKSSLENVKGRIKVDAYLRYPKDSSIYVVGDCAIATSRDVIHAPTAQLSAQMGDYVARSLIKILRGESQNEVFKFKHRGTVCSIGHTDGVGVIYNNELSGEMAAFLKNFIENKWLFWHRRLTPCL